MKINCNGKILSLGQKTIIMGILNVTPDSFSDGGNYTEIDAAVAHAKQMVEEGADIIDIGGESTRPGAPKITVEEEIKRVIPILKAVIKEVDVLISVDTYKAAVAEAALKNGAHIINDVWGFQKEPEIAAVIAKYKAAGIAMHNRQKNESQDTHNRRDFDYEQDIMLSIKDFFEKTFKIAKDAQLKQENIILDPGIGFGKRASQSIEVLSKLEVLKSFNQPLLLGTSRKSVIGEILDLPSHQRLEGTIATNVLGVMKGYDIVRVHDVKEHVRALKVIDAIIRG